MAYSLRNLGPSTAVRCFHLGMAGTTSTRVILTRAQRNAIFEEIEFAFESACDLPFMLEHAPQSTVDTDDARDLVTGLQAAVGLLDQIGWERQGDRDRYAVEVDADVDTFAARIETFALAGLQYNGQGMPTSADQGSPSVRRLIEADREKLAAARALRTAFMIARARRQV